MIVRSFIMIKRNHYVSEINGTIAQLKWSIPVLWCSRSLMCLLFGWGWMDVWFSADLKIWNENKEESSINLISLLLIVKIFTKSSSQHWIIPSVQTSMPHNRHVQICLSLADIYTWENAEEANHRAIFFNKWGHYCWVEISIFVAS